MSVYGTKFEFSRIGVLYFIYDIPNLSLSQMHDISVP